MAAPKKGLWGVLWFFTLAGIFVFFTNLTSENQFLNSEVTTKKSEDRFIAGRILMQPESGVSESEVDSIIAQVGARRIGHIKQIDLHVIQLPAHISDQAVEALLAHHPKIKFAERDRMVAPTEIANDPYFSAAWHIHKMNLPQAWEVAKGDGVLIAILDTGVDPLHPDLQEKLVAGYNFYDNNDNWADVHGHGTSVAGSAAAATNNSIGVSGVAWNARILPIRISGLDGYASWSALAKGITYAADRGARVANASYAAYGSSSVQSAANYMKSKGGLVTISAGNYSNLDSTVNSDSLLAISATDQNDVKTSWSSYGPYVDLSAPGTGIYVTRRGGAYGTASGTSFSAPIVAGVIALVFSANPNLTPKQVENILFTTAVDLGEAGVDYLYGYGRVNAQAAVLQALATPAADTTAPSVSFYNLRSGDKLAGAVNVQIVATDNNAVARVDLLVDNVLLGSTTQSPFELVIDTTKITEGNHTLTARAVDLAGNFSTASIGITVDNIVDTQAPVITSIKPADGATIKAGNVSVAATASDNEGVAGMSVFINGVLKATSNSGSISFTWNTRKLPAGSYTIRVEAKDLSGNIGLRSIIVKK